MSGTIRSLIKSQYFIVFLLGSISASAFAPFYLFPSAFIGFSGLFLIASQGKTKKESFWIGWYFGFGQFTFGLYWISISLFVDIAQFFWLLPFALFLIPAVLAIYVGLTLLLTNFISNKFLITGWRKIILLAVMWVFFEYLRGVLFTGFPWNLIGYSFLFSLSLSQISSIFGVLGLSLFAVIVYCSPALLFEICNKKIKFNINNNSKIFLSLIASCFVFIVVFGVNRIGNFQNEDLPNSTFRLVQPNTKQENKWDEKYRKKEFLKNIILSRSAGFSDVNHVVWSESAVPYVVDSSDSDLLFNIASGTPKNGFVITGGVKAEFKDGTKELKKIWNSIFIVNHHAQIVQSYDKNHLVPFGEYVPFADQLTFISKITNGAINFSEGNGLKTIKLNDQIPSFSPLICYEAIFSNNVIDRNDRPGFLLNLTNDAWFGNSSGPYQHFDMVKVRSIEYGLPTIRVANSGISGLINPVGEVVGLIPLNEKGIIDVRLMKNLPETIYGKFGNNIVLLLSIILLLASLIKRRS